MLGVASDVAAASTPTEARKQTPFGRKSQEAGRPDLDEARSTKAMPRPRTRLCRLPQHQLARRYLPVTALRRVRIGEATKNGARGKAAGPRSPAQFDIVRRRGGRVSVLRSITVNTPSR
jgi:hypothetical protein